MYSGAGIFQERSAAPLHWLSVQDDLSYVHEYEHITLVRVLLASDGSRVRAAALLDRLLQAGEAGAGWAA